MDLTHAMEFFFFSKKKKKSLIKHFNIDSLKSDT